MTTKLERISQLSRENPDMVFTSVGHLINKEILKGCRDVVRKLNGMIEERYTNYVLDADISGFFNHLNHEWVIIFYK